MTSCSLSFRRRILRKRYRNLVDFYLQAEPYETPASLVAEEQAASEKCAKTRYWTQVSTFLVTIERALSVKSIINVGLDDRAKLEHTLGTKLATDVLTAANALYSDGIFRLPAETLPKALENFPPILVETSEREKRAVLAKIGVLVLIADGLIPRFYEFDYVDTIDDIIDGLYPTNNGCLHELSQAWKKALKLLATGDGADPSSLQTSLRSLGFTGGDFRPQRQELASDYAAQIIPEHYQTWGGLRSNTAKEELNEINRQYSLRQLQKQGNWDNRDVSLLRGYEKDHLLLLRTLTSLLRQRRLCRDDKVLVVGPRHIDEIVFFRSVLGMRNTVGLDLFEIPNYISAGDMHEMPFSSDTFALVFTAGTISYAYDARKVISEMVRVLKKPGFIMLTDAMNRVRGVDPLGRSDLVNCQVSIGMFHRLNYRVLARDDGRSFNKLTHLNQTSFCLEILGDYLKDTASHSGSTT